MTPLPFMIPQITRNHEKRASFVTTEYTEYLEQRSRNQTGICPASAANAIPRRHHAPLVIIPPLFIMSPYVIASGAKQSPPTPRSEIASLRSQ